MSKNEFWFRFCFLATVIVGSISLFWSVVSLRHQRDEWKKEAVQALQTAKECARQRDQAFTIMSNTRASLFDLNEFVNMKYREKFGTNPPNQFK